MHRLIHTPRTATRNVARQLFWPRGFVAAQLHRDSLANIVDPAAASRPPSPSKQAFVRSDTSWALRSAPPPTFPVHSVASADELEKELLRIASVSTRTLQNTKAFPPVADLVSIEIFKSSDPARRSVAIYKAAAQAFLHIGILPKTTAIADLAASILNSLDPSALQPLVSIVLKALYSQHRKLLDILQLERRLESQSISPLAEQLEAATLQLVTVASTGTSKLATEAYVIAMEILSARGNSAATLQLFETMVAARVVPNADVFSYLVFANANTLGDAKLWFERFRASPLPKVQSPYFAMAAACLNHSQLEEMWAVLTGVMLEDGLVFDTVALNFVLGELTKNGFWEEAKNRYRLVEENKTAGLKANLGTHMIMLRNAVRHPDLALARHIYENHKLFVIPEISSLFELAVHENDLDFAIGLIKRDNILPLESIGTLLEKMEKAQRHSEICDLFCLMVEKRQSWLRLIRPILFAFINRFDLTLKVLRTVWPLIKNRSLMMFALRNWDIYASHVIDGRIEKIDLKRSDFEIVIDLCFSHPTNLDDQQIKAYLYPQITKRLQRLLRYHIATTSHTFPDSLNDIINEKFDVFNVPDEVRNQWSRLLTKNEQMTPIDESIDGEVSDELSDNLKHAVQTQDELAIRLILRDMVALKKIPHFDVLAEFFEKAPFLDKVREEVLQLIRLLPSDKIDNALSMFMNSSIAMQAPFSVVAIWKQPRCVDIITSELFNAGMEVVAKKGFISVWEAYTLSKSKQWAHWITPQTASLVLRALDKVQPLNYSHTSTFLVDMQDRDIKFVPSILSTVVMDIRVKEPLPPKQLALLLIDCYLDVRDTSSFASRKVYIECVDVLIDVYGDVQAATHVFAEMKRRGILPDVAVYHALLRGATAGGDLTRAVEVFEFATTNFSNEALVGAYGATRTSFWDVGVPMLMKRGLDEDWERLATIVGRIVGKAKSREEVMTRELVADIVCGLAARGDVLRAVGVLEVTSKIYEYPLIVYPVVAKSLIDAFLKTNFEKAIDLLSSWKNMVTKMRYNVEKNDLDTVREMLRVVIDAANEKGETQVSEKFAKMLSNIEMSIKDRKLDLSLVEGMI